MQRGLCGYKARYLVRVLFNHIVIIFVNIFLVCSISVIGLVQLSCPVKIGFFDIRKILLCFHIFGIVCNCRHTLTIFSKSCRGKLLRYFNISLEMFCGLVAL